MRLATVLCLRATSARSRVSRLDFSNTKEAFRTKSFGELLRQFLVYKVFTFDLLVSNSDKLIRWSRRLLGQRLFVWMMKRTFYGQFVAGETLSTIRPTVAHLRESGVQCILDYAVEEDVSDSSHVVLEHREQKESLNSLPQDATRDPHFSPSLSSAKDIKRASARTYLYAHDNQCQENMEHFLSCIKTAAQVTPPDSHPYAAVKLTGLGKLRLSEAVEGTLKIFKECVTDSRDVVRAHITLESFHRGLKRMGVDVSESESSRMFDELDLNKDGKLSVFEWANQFQPGMELHRVLQTKMVRSVATLDEESRLQMLAMVARAEELAACAQEHGVRVMVDAEQTYFQPAIRHITVNVLMPKFNLSIPVVYNTIQCYLKDAESMVNYDLALSRLAGFAYGIKLVRGAYMEQERAKAEREGYDSPIWAHKDQTDSCYNRVLDTLLKEVVNPSSNVHVMVASHNESTIQFATERMESYGIPPSSNSVVFGQLLGMCDYITFSLGQAGYGAYKYMPYGPVNDVLQYLQRRAHENSGMLEGAQYERTLVRREVLRRLRSPWR